MSDKVYIVTSGQYSDYGINAVFRTKEEAETYIEMYGLGSGYDPVYVEEWEFSTIPSKPSYCVSMLKNGDVNSVERTASYESNARRKETRVMGHWTAHPEGVLFAYMFADNDEHAIKIANERRTFLLASDMWNEGDHTAAVAAIIEDRNARE